LQLHCVRSVDVQVAPVPFAPQYPWQQGTSVEHWAASGAHAGASQKQVVPAVQVIRFSNASSV
jgi:hypothetical protein